ncbi:MAG TPA: carbonic anhydrase family protein [Myxococcota bacterium]|nr:carbonic anhydrase family protein [Myxococcota bacterium]
MKLWLAPLLVSLCLSAGLAGAQQTKESQSALTPDAALTRLKEGNARFAGNAPTSHDWAKSVAATAGGQYPFAAVLSCMDSRVPVEIVFDQGIGDVFSVRVAGNVVDDDDLGSLEYAAHVGVKLIVVMGHTKCGAVKGALDDVELGNLTGLLGKIKPSVSAAKCNDSHADACVDAVATENVRESMREIRARSPLLAKDIEAGKLELVGAIYDVSTGKVTFLSK